MSCTTTKSLIDLTHKIKLLMSFFVVLRNSTTYIHFTVTYVTWMIYWVCTHNLPFSVEEIRKMAASCHSCNILKPKFCKCNHSSMIKATSLFNRISMDFKDPLALKSQNKHILTLIDVDLFSLFGLPSYVHKEGGRNLVFIKRTSKFPSRFGSRNFQVNTIPKKKCSNRKRKWHDMENYLFCNYTEELEYIRMW